MVGFIISVKVTFMPCAIAAADSIASVNLETILIFIIAGPDRTLIFRASTSFEFRHVIPRTERLHAGSLAERFQVAL
jgi:hypothetical protein